MAAFATKLVSKVTKPKRGRPKRRRGPKPKPKPKVEAKKPVARKKQEKPLSKKAKAEIQKLSGVKLTELKNKTPSEQREYLKAKSDIAENRASFLLLVERAPISALAFIKAPVLCVCMFSNSEISSFFPTAAKSIACPPAIP